MIDENRLAQLRSDFLRSDKVFDFTCIPELFNTIEALLKVARAAKGLKHTEECTDANNCCAEDCFCGYDELWLALSEAGID